MGEARKFRLDTIVNGSWVHVGDAEIVVSEEGAIEKVISFTPRDFSDPNILKVASVRVDPKDVPRVDEKA